jgi:hypothetical protein
MCVVEDGLTIVQNCERTAHDFLCWVLEDLLSTDFKPSPNQSQLGAAGIPELPTVRLHRRLKHVRHGCDRIFWNKATLRQIERQLPKYGADSSLVKCHCAGAFDLGTCNAAMV